MALTPTLLLMILGILSAMTVSEDTTISDEAVAISSGYEDYEAFTEPSFSISPDAVSPNLSCHETLMESVHQSDSWSGMECPNATTENSSLPTNAASVSPTPNSDLSRFSVINTGMLSEKTYGAIVRIAYYCKVPIVLVGILLNIFSVAVYLQPAMRRCSSTYLAALCSTQLLFLLCDVPVVLLGVIQGKDATTGLASLIVTYTIGLYVSTTLRRITFTLTFIVCIERLLAVAFPLKYRQMRLSSHPARVSIVCALIVAVPHLYFLIKYEFVPIENGNYMARITSIYMQSEAFMSALAMILRIAFAYVTLIGIIVVNVLTTIVMRRHRQTSKHLTTNRDDAKKDKAEKQTTLTILVSSFVFVLFSLPSNINPILNELLPDYGFMKKEHNLFFALSGLLKYLDYMSNFLDFFSYVILSKRFRKTFLKLIGHKTNKAENVVNPTTITDCSSRDDNNRV